MRTRFFLPLIFILYWSCEWQPTGIPVDASATIKQVNLVVGDTIAIYIAGQDFSPLEGLEPNIAHIQNQLGAGSDSRIEIIGLQPGELNLFFRYRPDQDVAEDPSEATYSILLRITESTPLFLHVGDTQTLDLAGVLTSDQVNLLDSVALIAPDSGNPGQLSIVAVQNHPTQFMLTGDHPGATNFSLECYGVNQDLLFVLAYEVSISIHKMVLAELFTNSGCVNCPEANHYLDNLLADFEDDFALVRYHVAWTDPSDPMNLYNPGEVYDRVLYYNAWPAPSLVIDGTLIGGALSEENWNSEIINAYTAGSDVFISSIDVSESVDSLHIEFDINTFEEVMTDLSIWSLVYEDSIAYAGSNGEDLHMQVMRDMNFTPMSTIHGLVQIQHGLKKPEDYGLAGPMNILIFVQSNSDQAVLQARVQAL